jgi:hypothetical protein
MQEQDIVRLAKEALDDSVMHLDAPTLSRLNRARHEALEAAPAASSWSSSWNSSWNSSWSLLQIRTGTAIWGNWRSLGGASCALLLAVIIALPGKSPSNSSADQFNLPLLVEEGNMAALEDTELLEDLDMMLWLVDQENHAS